MSRIFQTLYSRRGGPGNQFGRLVQAGLAGLVGLTGLVGLADLLVAAGTARAVAAAPQPLEEWSDGLELVYRGEVCEEVRRPAQEFRRVYQLDVQVIVLHRTGKWADVAVVTRVQLRPDVVTQAVEELAGQETEPPPAVVRVDWVRRYVDGTVHQLHPEGMPPLHWSATTPVRPLPPPPVDGVAHFETGMFPPRRPSNLRPDESWTVAAGPQRPPETWRVAGQAYWQGELCDRWEMEQPAGSPPEGRAIDWYRQQTLWISLADGIPRQVYRRSVRHDGDRLRPWAVIETRYTLATQTVVAGRQRERIRRDLEVASCALRDAAGNSGRRTTAQLRQLELHRQRLNDCLAESSPGDIYREAVQAALRAVEAARRGETVLPAAVDPPLPARWPAIGETLPDAVWACFPLQETARSGDTPSAAPNLRLIVLAHAHGETTELTLAIANALQKLFAKRVTVHVFVGFGDRTHAHAICQRRGWTVPLHDGREVVAALAAETLPRFLIVDRRGAVRWSFCGVGAETGYLLRRELERLLNPSETASPVSPAATTPPATAEKPPQP